MTGLLSELIQAFSRLKVAVLGDAMLDTYFTGTTGRLCQEAPVPIVDVAQRRDLPGGAANSALNVRDLGALPLFFSVVGDDAEAAILRKSLADRGIASEHLVARPNRRTLWKSRVMADSHMAVRFDQGSTHLIDEEAERQLMENARRVVPECDLVLVSDYGYGVITPRIIDLLGELRSRHGFPIVVDSKNLPAFRNLGVMAVKPNYRETMKLLGVADLALPTKRWEDLASLGDRVLEMAGAEIAAVTLDSEGALIFERGSPPYRTYAQPAPHFHAAGAGDTFLATMALALAAGATTPLAAELASSAAAVVVSKEHTATCSAVELLERMAGTWLPSVELSEVLPQIDQHRGKGRRIVFTNGCFDILHQGHVHYLQQARALGDVLVVGVNSDESVRRIKGPDRPINGLGERVAVLAALRCVDHLVRFDEETPHRLIEAIRPDVFVKGGDYTRETLPEASLVEQLGGSVKILPFVADRSTTGIIQRICQVYGRKEKPAVRGRPAARHANGNGKSNGSGGNGNGSSDGNGNGSGNGGGNGSVGRRPTSAVRSA